VGEMRGEDAPVGGEVARPLNPPNRRIRDPYVRWCGRGGATRLPSIPIRRNDESVGWFADRRKR
jgi:hypothetical protein